MRNLWIQWYLKVMLIFHINNRPSRFIEELTSVWHLCHGTVIHLPVAVAFMVTAWLPPPRDRHYHGRPWSLFNDRTVESFRVLAALLLGLVNEGFGSFVIVWVAESGSQLCSAIVLSVRSLPLLALQSSICCRRRALCWCLVSAHPRLVCNPRCVFSENYLSMCLYEWIIRCYSLAGSCVLHEDGSRDDGTGVCPHFADQVSILARGLLFSAIAMIATLCYSFSCQVHC